MHADILITDAEIVSSDGVSRGGLAISAGKIVQIGNIENCTGERVLNAHGLLAMPGLIDTQVHFREPGMEHKEDLESGTRAAIHGGVTSILEMPNTSPPTSSQQALADKLTRARGRAWCNFGFFVGATHENVADLAALERADGCPGVKLFMGSSTGSLLVESDEAIAEVLRCCRKRVAVHAEDEQRNRERRNLVSDHPSVLEHPFLRDAESATLATERIIRLSRTTGRPIHILHVSTLDELPIILQAKQEGIHVTCEVTPQHLFFAAPECYENLGTRVQMNPPIRSEQHRSALWRALNSGLFDVFGSDHAPHTLEEKSRPYPASPSGMPGVQTLLPVLMHFASQGKLTHPQIVRMGAENPATLYGIQRKGFLRQGFDADLVLVDPNCSRTVERSMIQSKCGWSPYEGMLLKGWPRHVILGGQIAVEDDQRVGAPAGVALQFA